MATKIRFITQGWPTSMPARRPSGLWRLGLALEVNSLRVTSLNLGRKKKKKRAVLDRSPKVLFYAVERLIKTPQQANLVLHRSSLQYPPHD